MLARYGYLNGDNPEAEARYQERLKTAERYEKQRELAAREASMRKFFDRIGARYSDCTLRSFRIDHEGQRKAVETVRKFIVDLKLNLASGSGLLLYGPVGTGKDHLMVAAAREAIVAGASVAWFNGVDFYAALRDAISNDRPESDIVRELVAPQVLCLSDPLPPIVPGNANSKGSLTDYQAAVMFRVIDRRYRDRKSTWATFNVTGGVELLERLGAPLVDRLRDGAVSVPCEWPSFRKSQ